MIVVGILGKLFKDKIDLNPTIIPLLPLLYPSPSYHVV